ncbi:LuxR family transcriptional regulator [Sulfitobacter geojensis]|uniref:Autoinducer binding domain-containing protein n=1 Tax=Sulfitobacter geojensis TaxID=1342299 RepID=A0AAE2VVT2_9RHOB|nr:LuxR family transcriptional regulator [Sulfitobacter geojensis]KHA52360.1 Autoinducer-binding transcriptional regulator, LuxR family [Sulfitobacter geojensis]MBM1688274.1 autoinducer binding domain-containing protein [Sulfitobacter geojensis]MBM1692341.1 autoinducer binding domain-containing protein [Sulfitobacter geojensis]MBM1704507.1 autoinducer binding domain-containing protein [Sulfitobacter geojensis]MBM1708565.1 autoinducer binding domain-containing protein [Sulfitobacter geojensis]
MSLRDYLHFIARCPSIEELWDAHLDKMAGYGFDRLIYGFTRYRTSTSLGDPEDFVILTNHSRAYTDEFITGGLYYHAPMVHWALANDGACSWTVLHDMARERAMTPAEERVVDFNRRMQVFAGYTVSFKSISARSKGAIALTARADISQAEIDDVWAEHGNDIKLMNDIAHLKILTLPYTAPNRGLTNRQREALEWVGDGKTMQDIAILMGLTSATVEKHLRLAREALAVDTTAQAVLKASFANQIFVLDA